MHHTLARLLAATALMALMLGGGTAFAAQPTNVINSEVRAEPEPLTPGPHCHVVLPAGDNQGFDEIVTATRHEAHLRTVPGRVFDATVCPNPEELP